MKTIDQMRKFDRIMAQRNRRQHTIEIEVMGWHAFYGPYDGGPFWLVSRYPTRSFPVNRQYTHKETFKDPASAADYAQSLSQIHGGIVKAVPWVLVPHLYPSGGSKAEHMCAELEQAEKGNH